MTNDSESKVPLDLQHAFENAEDAGGGPFALMDVHPPEEWHDCPECGTRLHAQSAIWTGDNDLIAVRYSCECRALWVWEVETDDLHYRGEAELVQFSDLDDDG